MKKTFRILDMHCANCSMRIESIEDELPGVREVNASYHKGQMLIDYDEKLVEEEQIIAAVKKKGYQAVPV